MVIAETISRPDADGKRPRTVRDMTKSNAGHFDRFSGCPAPALCEVLPMCNSYRIKPKRGAARGLAQRVSDAAAKRVPDLVRKSDPGVVLRSDGRVEVMRWGFHRSFNPSINNARADKLEGGMWADSFRKRRCVIPMSLFYEWGPGQGRGAGGRKQAYEFRDPTDDFLWAAGIWEDHTDLGPCYSMVTTAASPLMVPIHDRMPALLRPEEMAEFLAGTSVWDFQPFAGPLELTPCESPLVKPKVDADSQPELF
jgi:putative SOS response-associated peptidase YedK